MSNQIALSGGLSADPKNSSAIIEDKGIFESVITVQMKGRHAMCRNIKVLYNFEPPASQAEIRAAAEQYVRKISGFAKPSAANQPTFERAIEEVARSSARLLKSLVTAAPPRNRELEAARAHSRALRRFGASGNR
jgi:hypothetical protein